MRRSWMAGLGVVVLATAGCTGSMASVQIGQLSGRWAWQSASGGIAGRTITPATEGYTMELRLTAEGDAQLLRNGAVTQTAKYLVGLGKKGGSFADQDVVRFTPTLLGSWDEMGVSFPDPTRLLLADGCCDGFTYTFVRIGSAP